MVLRNKRVPQLGLRVGLGLYAIKRDCAKPEFSYLGTVDVADRHGFRVGPDSPPRLWQRQFDQSCGIEFPQYFAAGHVFGCAVGLPPSESPTYPIGDLSPPFCGVLVDDVLNDRNLARREVSTARDKPSLAHEGR